MSIFKKKQPVSQGSVLTDHYVPARLPRYGAGIDTFSPTEYRLLSEAYVAGLYHDCESALIPLTRTADRYSVGKLCDGFVDGQIKHQEAQFHEEIANHERQIIRIRSANAVRKGIVERRMTELGQTCDRLDAEIEPLRDRHTQFEITFGRFHISYGALITVAAMVVDGFLNYSYLNTILLQNVALLLVTVVGLSVMSDGSMFVLGSLLSRQKEKFMNKWLFWSIAVVMAVCFALSVVSSVMIRFGSMDVTFGTINAAGEFVGKTGYSMAEWGISLITAFLTTVTGAISFGYSVDENAHLVNRRRKLEKRLEEAEAEYTALKAELDALERAPDPEKWDLECRKAAKETLEALRNGLKQHMRKLQAVYVGEAGYTDTMAESAQELLSAQPQTASRMLLGSADTNKSEEIA